MNSIVNITHFLDLKLFHSDDKSDFWIWYPAVTQTCMHKHSHIFTCLLYIDQLSHTQTCGCLCSRVTNLVPMSATLAKLSLMWSVESLSYKYNVAVSACHVWQVFVSALWRAVSGENELHLRRINTLQQNHSSGRRKRFSSVQICNVLSPWGEIQVLDKRLEMNYLFARLSQHWGKDVLQILWAHQV